MIYSANGAVLYITRQSSVIECHAKKFMPNEQHQANHYNVQKNILLKNLIQLQS